MGGGGKLVSNEAGMDEGGGGRVLSLSFNYEVNSLTT